MRPDIYAAGSAYHRQRAHLAPCAVKCLELAMRDMGTPASLLDVGCGLMAPVVHACRERDIDAVGVDIAVTPVGWLCHHDLRTPLDLGRTFEWVTCWEVAEHLPVNAADVLCDTLVRHLAPEGRLLFTAAHPRQHGPGHIHLREPEYWRRLLVMRDLVYLEERSRQLRDVWRTGVPQARWYGDNVQVFRWAAQV